MSVCLWQTLSVKAIVCPLPMLLPESTRLRPALCHFSYFSVDMLTDEALPPLSILMPCTMLSMPGTGSVHSPVIALLPHEAVKAAAAQMARYLAVLFAFMLFILFYRVIVVVAGMLPVRHFFLSYTSSMPSSLPRLRLYCRSVALFQCSATPSDLSGVPSPSGSYAVPDGALPACAASMRYMSE